MKVVLDTNVFHNWKFLLWLKDSPYSPVTSSIAYAEYLYHQSKKLGSIEEGKSAVDTLFQSIRIEVMEFDKECAVETVRAVWGRWGFRKKCEGLYDRSASSKAECSLDNI
ncbi:PIN domain-containing protein [Pyrococcus kukulkanii]|uniref:PIN domain-containing protein n=1 Tax=Pyrococcus kukulkanii TaxID=1609559 RepID=UPI000A96A3F0|nr:PIN domain-containing protein [Pyrococcus kukulkanii]